jgi:hypothetical protein
MLKLLRRLVGSDAPGETAKRPGSATAEVLARRHAAAAGSERTAPEPLDFDPYNTGAFDRAASWERISKRDF